MYENDKHRNAGVAEAETQAKWHPQSHTASEGQSKDLTLTGHDSGGEQLQAGGDGAPHLSVPQHMRSRSPFLPSASAQIDVGYAFDFCASLHLSGWRL